MKPDDFLQSKMFRAIVLGITGFAILVIVFQFGVIVGTVRSDFSFRWAEEYHKNFAGPQTGFLGNMMRDNYASPNGCFGRILQMTIFSQFSTKLIVEDSNGTEKVVLVSDKTIIKKQDKNIKPSDLQVNDNIVTIGDPNPDGAIQAQLIRVMSLPLKNDQDRNSVKACIIKAIIG